MARSMSLRNKIKYKAMRHPDILGAGAKKRKEIYGKHPKTKEAKQEKASVVMREFYRGTLRHGGSGKIVPKNRPDIAKAIAMSEAGLSRKKRRR